MRRSDIKAGLTYRCTDGGLRRVTDILHGRRGSLAAYVSRGHRGHSELGEFADLAIDVMPDERDMMHEPVIGDSVTVDGTARKITTVTDQAFAAGGVWYWSSDGSQVCGGPGAMRAEVTA